MYDSYVSLGNNCEAGFQFKRIGYNESSFFRWTLSPFQSTFNSIQNNFQNLYLKDNLVPVWDNMVQDTKYKINFHSKLLSKKEEKDNQRYFLSNYNFDQIYQEEYHKIQHFIQKWFSLVNSDKLVLYIIKEENNSNKTNAEKLLKLFKQKYPNHKFTIAYLQEEKYKESDWRFTNLKNIYFPYFAPGPHADRGDVEAWDKLFMRFPLRDG